MSQARRSANRRPTVKDGAHTLRISMTSWQFSRLRLAAHSFGWSVERWARIALIEAAEDAIAVDSNTRGVS